MSLTLRKSFVKMSVEREASIKFRGGELCAERSSKGMYYIEDCRNTAMQSGGVSWVKESRLDGSRQSKVYGRYSSRHGSI